MLYVIVHLSPTVTDLARLIDQRGSYAMHLVVALSLSMSVVIQPCVVTLNSNANLDIERNHPERGR